MRRCPELRLRRDEGRLPLPREDLQVGGNLCVLQWNASGGGQAALQYDLRLRDDEGGLRL